MKLIDIKNTGEQAPSAKSAAIAVGISSCLLGAEVRYNGGHSRSRLCTDLLASYFDFRPFCPEMAAGLGTPRPTLRLTGDPDAPRLEPSKGGEDLAAQLVAAAAPALDRAGDLDGYILMKNSPSCGMERVKVYQDNGHPHERRRDGLFAAELKRRYPLLPIEEEGRLHDAHLFENFVLRVFVHNRFRTGVLAKPALGRLMNFHRDHKYLLMAHSAEGYRALGRMLAETPRDADMERVARDYFTGLMKALARPASRRGHANALLHLLGYLKKQVPGKARQHIASVVDRYRRGELNLATPLTLIGHYAEQAGPDYLLGQLYLAPYPAELGLQSRV